MEKSKEEFVVFIRQAVNDESSDSFTQLYNFLVNCFTRADVNNSGKVDLYSFDSLIEEAAEMPRKYGFAPQTSEMYATLRSRKEARAKMFSEMDSNGDGNITLEEWVTFAKQHIIAKVAGLPKDCLGGSATNVTKEDFACFIKKAVNKDTAEYRELYYFLLMCFMEADKDRDGAVNHVEFDRMIEVAAAAPRRFGLAPKSKDMFKNEAERLQKRKEYFSSMDVNKDGKISFDEWLNYAFNHIVVKAASLK